MLIRMLISNALTFGLFWYGNSIKKAIIKHCLKRAARKAFARVGNRLAPEYFHA